jgi:hypothetical protein
MVVICLIVRHVCTKESKAITPFRSFRPLAVIFVFRVRRDKFATLVWATKAYGRYVLFDFRLEPPLSIKARYMYRYES